MKTMSCPACSAAHKLGTADRCLECKFAGCVNCLRQHVMEQHTGSRTHLALVQNALRQVCAKGKDYGVTSYTDSQTTITRTGATPAATKSPWLKAAETLGIRAFIVSVKLPRQEEETREAISKPSKLLESLGAKLEAYTIRGTTASLLLSLPKAGADPEDRRLRDILPVSPSATRQKAAKRLAVGLPAEGATALPRHSPSGVIHITPALTLNVGIKDTNGTGDGGGVIKRSAVNRWFGAAGINKNRRRIYAVYIQAAGEDYLKACLHIAEDNEYPGIPGTDLTVDAECVSRQVNSQDWTLTRLIPLRRSKGASRTQWVEGLMQFHTAQSFLDLQDALARMHEDVLQEDSRLFGSIKAGSWEPEEAEWWAALADRTPRREEKTAAGLSGEPAKQIADLTLEASGGSPFSSPQAMTRASSTWLRKVQSAIRKGYPAITLPGFSATLGYHGYCGVPEPPENHIRLVWGPEETPDMVTVAESDYRRLSYVFDTWDFDTDRVSVFLLEQAGRKGALLLRLPMSIDGGHWFEMTGDDIARLEELGYRWQPMTGGHRWPGLHEADENGNQIIPPSFTPDTSKDEEPWPAEETGIEAALHTLRPMAASNVGRATLLLAAHDFSGIHPPPKINLSEDVIDATAEAGEQVVNFLTRSLWEAVSLQKRPLCRCIADRVARSLEEHHYGITEEPFRFYRKCPPEHGRVWIALHKLESELAARLAKRQLLANGPSRTLTLPTGPKTRQAAEAAETNRRNLWREWLRQRENIEEDDQLNPMEQAQMVAAGNQQVQAAEKTIAYTHFTAAERDPGYIPGEFVRAWIQASRNSAKNYPGTFRTTLAPLRLNALALLPQGELKAHFASDDSEPTSMLRVPESAGIQRKLLEASELTVGKDSKGNLVLSDREQTICNLRAEARPLQGRTLLPLGLLPPFDGLPATETAQSERPAVLAVKVVFPQVL